MAREIPREKSLELAVSAIERQFGKGSIMRLGDGASLFEGVEVIPTGCLPLDIGLGIGGVPKGRIIEIYGPESSGKTTLALHIVANAQKGGGVAAFVDAEHALDVTYAKKLGVKTEELLISQPDYGEQALEIADMLVKSNAIDVLVVDSVAALVPKAELEGEMGDSHMGLHARLMSQALRKLTGSISKSKTAVIFINQIRNKIGVMFGNPETTTGGNALKFYATVRMDIRRIGAIKNGQEAIGNQTRVTVVKNKMAPPFRKVVFDIMYGEGISRTGSLLDEGVKIGAVDKSGSWFSYQGERLGQGREKVKQRLAEDDTLANTLEGQILEHYGLNNPHAKDADCPHHLRRRGPRRFAGSVGGSAGQEPAFPPGGHQRGSALCSMSIVCVEVCCSHEPASAAEPRPRTHPLRQDFGPTRFGGCLGRCNRLCR
ncbi:MAG: recombinase RecA [Proteobacteria bacterium]|nr:MAG: recombinase RecA [Pseudomonadota bacterium]